MSEDCRRVKESLDQYAVDLIGPSGIDHAHLKGCPSCASGFWQAEALRRQLTEYARGIEEAAVPGMEGVVLARLQSAPLSQAAPKLSTYWRLIAASAAVLCLTVAIWLVLPKVEPLRQQTGLEFLSQVEREAGRQEIARYLDRSQLVVYSLLEGAHECPEDQSPDLQLERSWARDLLFQKQLLNPQLNRPGYEDIKRVCDEMEMVLLDFAGSENCVSPDQVRTWQEILDSRSTLIRLQLLRMEAT